MKYYNPYAGVLTVNLEGATSSESESGASTAMFKSESINAEAKNYYTKEIDSETFLGQKFSFSNEIFAGNIINIKVKKNGVYLTSTFVFDGEERTFFLNSEIQYTVNSQSISFSSIENTNDYTHIVISILRTH